MTPVCLCLEIEHNHCIFLTWIHILSYRVIDSKLVGNCTMVTTLASTNNKVALAELEVLQTAVYVLEIQDVRMMAYVFT